MGMVPQRLHRVTRLNTAELLRCEGRRSWFGRRQRRENREEREVREVGSGGEYREAWRMGREGYGAWRGFQEGVNGRRR
jgi:hypothetical protein